ncbi:MAG: PASTA domain-containing protein [Ruminococcaceae bacterium]|nr:PASTA domain-containing protein [Oscillospiraceae bacterium]
MFLSADKSLRPTLVRMAVIIIAFLLALILLITNLVNKQIINAEFYRQKAVAQYTTETSINPRRGTIYDRNMNQLAVSVSVENVFISPNEIAKENEEKIADYLSELLGADREELLRRMDNKKNKYYVVKKQVERDVTDEIRTWMQKNDLTDGIHFEENTKRSYPNANLASHVLGFTGYDNNGLYGIEAKYDNELKGAPGKLITAQDGHGKSMPFEYEDYIGAENGNNLVLTIDLTIQSFLEKALDAALEDTKAQNRVLGIVMDVNTGEILAMSVKPDYDPNSPYTLDEESLKLLEAFEETEEKSKNDYRKELLDTLWKNKCVTELYEPGSTFKLVTSAIAMEENKVSENDTFYCSGSMMVKGWSKPISCHKREGHGTETFEQGLQNSCNPVFMQLAAKIGKEKFYRYFEEFGCMDITGIDLPGEASGIYHTNLSSFNDVELATYSFGQTFTITPIRLLSSVCAVANGGNLMQPYVVKAVTDSDGQIIKSIEPKVQRQIISKETSQTIMEYLADGINVGSTKNAYVKGYPVAAKTGTAEKHGAEKDKAGNITPYVASCVAFAPANDPQVAILVAIDTPTNGQYYGGVVAAPVVSQVLTDTLPYLNIPPVLSDEEKESMAVAVEEYRAMSLEEAKKKIESLGFKAKVLGDGDVVNEQFPRVGDAISGNGVIVLYTGSETPANTATVPNCIGLSASAANKAVVNSNLNIYIEGSYREGVGGAAAVAVSQSPAAGEKVQPGTVVTVSFKHLDGTD